MDLSLLVLKSELRLLLVIDSKVLQVYRMVLPLVGEVQLELIFGPAVELRHVLGDSFHVPPFLELVPDDDVLPVDLSVELLFPVVEEFVLQHLVESSGLVAFHCLAFDCEHEVLAKKG